MMPRNLNRRVEVLTPVLDKELRDYSLQYCSETAFERHCTVLQNACRR